MGSFTFAWLVGEGIVIYRSVTKQGGPPWPGQMLWSSLLYVILAMVAEAGDGGRKLSLTLAWGLNAAAFLAIFPNVTPQTLQQSKFLGAVTATQGWWGVVKTSTIPAGTIFPSGLVSGTAATTAAASFTVPTTAQQAPGSTQPSQTAV